jgi:sensor histidine kinase YesM
VEGGHICIGIQPQGSAIIFEVTDTGGGINGYQPASLFTKGIGLENTRQRLHKLFGAELKVAPNLPKGFQVQFALPLKPQHA